MVWSFALVLLLAAQAAAPPSVREVAYLPLGGGDRGAAQVLETLAGEVGAAGPVRFRRSSRDPEALRRCLDDRALIDRVNRCVRRLLPAREGGAPLVALAIENEIVSNVTGSRTFVRHNVYCIGHRSIARAQTGDRLQARGAAGRAREAVRACIVEAAVPAPLGTLRLSGGAAGPLWRLAVGAVAEDEGHARGSSAEHVTVRIESRRAARRGACRLTARVVSVEQGERLREGDLVRVALPCAPPAAGARPVLARPEAIRPGARARLYIGYDGGLRFVDPL